MPKNKKGNPIYSKGDVVYAPVYLKDKQLVVKDTFHNGFVWMCGFENDDISMGESYLVRELPPKSIREMLIESVDNIKSVDGFSCSMMRWRTLMFKGYHIRDVDYSTLSDSDLVDFYTLVTVQVHKQY
jgi:hypothetical protein